MSLKKHLFFCIKIKQFSDYEVECNNNECPYTEKPNAVLIECAVNNPELGRVSEWSECSASCLYLNTCAHRENIEKARQSGNAAELQKAVEKLNRRRRDVDKVPNPGF